MLELMKELFTFLRQRKKYWVAPVLIIIVLLGAVLVLSSGTVVAPFIYTLF